MGTHILQEAHDEKIKNSPCRDDIRPHNRTLIYKRSQQITLRLADIAEIECGKWAHLHITLKDGRVITEDGCNYGEVDMKWASAEYFYDKNYNEVAQ
jgi:hypothetical protein